ncbi:acyltransferase family protein [Marinigracilibium pacificum]|uniref:Acyltransferase family protein n=1 Tax=Marinigracilibium pacificum TaxID=2729599 RepID=A0A848J5R4_9BACT|nr:acyltransferase family protein [Marinigracilibium pacificum]NMM50805.1 acyltransferase family protein [Marinigracilibium pacificum]
MITERRYDIDWLRVIAIGLLLIYHIAIIFQPWAMFIGFIRSNELIEGLWKPMTMLNVWRIPLLFYVSGMGLYFAMRKRDLMKLLIERTQRILVPLLFGIALITPIHIFILQKYYNMPYAYMPGPAHLWFLGNIFVYVLVLSPFLFFLKKREGGSFSKKLNLLFSNPIGPLSISAFFILEVILVKPALFEMYAETWHGFFIGFLAFLFGFLFVYCGNTFWQTVLKWRWLYLILALSLYCVRLFVYELNAPHTLMAAESNCWILAIFGLGYKHLNKPGKALAYLSQAAYPVYIIHMFVLYAGAALILPLKIPVELKFLSIVIFTGTVCFLIYEFIIRRVGFVRPLFGLKMVRYSFIKLCIEKSQLEIKKNNQY